MQLMYFIIGSCVGSFICLIGERVPIKQSILRPRSHCTGCQHSLHFFDLLPILSIIFLRFRCRYCHHRLSSIYFFTELSCGIIFVTAFECSHPLYVLLFLLGAVVLSVTDCLYTIVEPYLFFPLVISLFIFHASLQKPFFWLTSVFIFLVLQYLNHVFANSIGGGDIYLLTAWAALIPLESFVFLIFVASTTGLCCFFINRFYFHLPLLYLPFVPFLTLGLYSTFLFH